MGRKSTFNAKDAAQIVERLSKGEPLTHICADDWMPCDDTVRAWAEANAEFGRDIARAREAGFDRIAMDALAIADNTANDTKLVGEGDTPACNAEWISRSKLRVETRLKLLAKWDPKRYGDAVQFKHADAHGEKLKLDEVGTVTRLAAIAAQVRGRSDAADDAD